MITAGILAFITMNLVSLLYFNPPRRQNVEQGTDYVWEKNFTSIRGNEGYAINRTNNEGYT